MHVQSSAWMGSIAVTHFTDPGCPWAYSASPALAVLRWRYGAQLDWRTVTIGLSEDPQRYIELGYTPTRMAVGNLGFRRYGMPFAAEPRARVAATARACRAIVATRLLAPGREHDVLRALQFGWFTTTLVLDEDADIATALSRVEGLDVERDRRGARRRGDARRLRGRQGAHAHRRGRPHRFPGQGAPDRRPGALLRAVAGVRERRPAPGGGRLSEHRGLRRADRQPRHDARRARRRREDPHEALARFPGGLVSQEVAAIMAHNNQPADRDAAERALVELAGAGRARRTPLGDDALWQPA